MTSHPWLRRAGIGLGALGLLAAADQAGSGGARAAVFEPETFTLDNGMPVVVVTNRSVPVVGHMVWYGVGAADEPPGSSGLAHFLEHLMFRGTGEVPDGAFSRTVARHGGVSNAFTGYDFTAYFQSVAKEHLPLVMELEADRMTGLELDPELVATERDVIVEERRQRTDNDPSARLTEQMIATLYQNHPYGTPVIGWEHEIRALDLEAVQAFYDRWYDPASATLIVAGDIDAEELRPLAEATYGRIPAGEVPERARPSEPPQGAERRVILEDPAVGQPSWRRYYLAPSYSDSGPAGDGSEDTERLAYALQVLNEILGAGDTSRLYQSLVVEQQLAVGAGTAYSPESLDQTSFVAYAVPRPGVSLEAVEAAVDAAIERLLTDGVTEDELDSARQRLITEAAYARDSIIGPAMLLGRALTTGQTIEDVEAWPERIEAVTGERVLAAARLVLDEDRSVTGLLQRAAETAELTQ